MKIISSYYIGILLHSPLLLFSEYKHQQLVDKKNYDAKAHEVTALEYNLKRVTSTTTKQNKDITAAVDTAAGLRNQIKMLETKIEKQRKSMAKIEEERDRYLVEATDQARRVIKVFISYQGKAIMHNIGLYKKIRTKHCCAILFVSGRNTFG